MKLTRSRIRAARALAPLWLMLIGGPVPAHEGEKHPAKKIDYAKAEKQAFGQAADPARASRTITVEMSDRMRFTPDAIEISEGSVVRFVIRNRGMLLHEMVLGTDDELETHAALMKKFPGMEHEEPHMAHVSPGKEAEMGWRFDKAGEYFYGCLIPGHFEAGMVGRITVR